MGNVKISSSLNHNITRKASIFKTVNIINVLRIIAIWESVKNTPHRLVKFVQPIYCFIPIKGNSRSTSLTWGLSDECPFLGNNNQTKKHENFWWCAKRLTFRGAFGERRNHMDGLLFQVCNKLAVGDHDRCNHQHRRDNGASQKRADCEYIKQGEVKRNTQNEYQGKSGVRIECIFHGIWL